MSLKEIQHEGVYFEPRVVLNNIIKPSLIKSDSVQILAGFFSLASLLDIVEGLEVFLRKNGVINLIVGVPKKGLGSHNKDLLDSIKDAEDKDIASLYTESILEEAGRLTTELQKDKVRVAAYLIKKELLNVKFAINEGGHVHSKIYLFQDEEGNKLVAAGSMNFTPTTFNDNIENIDISTSWEEDPKKKWSRHENHLANMWKNKISGVSVFDADSKLADKLLKVVGEKDIDALIDSIESSSSAVDLYFDIINSPVWLEYTLSRSSLYPHQVSAVQDALKKWPVRNLFADEVGLGKTLEVGATISYLIKHKNIDRVLILAPASVTSQWQSEMMLHFGISFYRYDNKSKSFLNLEKEEVKVSNINEYQDSFPKFTIMSKDRATGYFHNHLFKDTNIYPDLLVLDEAHHARGYKDNEVFGETQLRNMINNIKDSVKHILFASATPMRTNVLEYYYLLQLLGLEALLSEKEYQQTLGELGKEANNIDPVVLAKMFSLAVRVFEVFSIDSHNLTEQEKEAYRLIESKELNVQTIAEHLDKQEAIVSLLVKFHPTSLFTSRNYRNVLEAFPTYKFPERVLVASGIKDEELGEDLDEFFYQLVEFAEKYYLTTETGFGRVTRKALGVAMFKESFVSSYSAAKERVLNRKKKVEGYINDAEEEIYNLEHTKISVDNAEEEEEAIDLEIEVSDKGPDWEMIRSKGWEEIGALNEIITISEEIDRISKQENNKQPDPKLRHLLEIIKKHFNSSKKPVLVFAKYLATIDAAVDYLDSNLGNELEGIGVFKGGGQIYVKFQDLDWEKKTKEEVKNYLNKGMIDILFCSTAAQEGINLQAASMIVNIDVPWVPSDLEQRIGRIARLGQKEDKVIIHNLWYPKSYEAKIYKRLLERQDLLELALGKFPDIVSSAIKKESYSKEDSIGLRGCIDTLSDIKLDMSYASLSRLWEVSTKDVSPRANLFRENIKASFTGLGLDFSKLTTEAGEENSISFRDTDIENLCKGLEIMEENSSKVFALNHQDKLYGFLIEDEGKAKVLNPYFLPNLLQGLLSTMEINLEFLQEESIVTKKELVDTYKLIFPEWLISSHNDFVIFPEKHPFEDDDSVLEKKYIGTVNIKK